jgi:hypothetical protein
VRNVGLGWGVGGKVPIHQVPPDDARVPDEEQTVGILRRPIRKYSERQYLIVEVVALLGELD